MSSSNLRAAAQQALETLDGARRYGFALKRAEIDALVDALRAALAEPVQEPVAWRVRRDDGQYELYFVKASAERAAECYIKHPQVEPLYAAPPQRKPLTDEPQQTHSPDCWRWHHECAISKIQWMHTPLTEKEIKQAVLDDPMYGAALMHMMRDDVVVAQLRQTISGIARAVEKAHGIGGSNE